MVKSTRSKWKKAHKRIKAQLDAPNVAKRVARLSHKLNLAATGESSKEPFQDPETRFHFSAPTDSRRPGQRLSLAQMRTNPYGKSNPDAPHPQTVQYEVMPADAPKAGRALTIHDARRAEQQNAFTPEVTIEAGDSDDDRAVPDLPVVEDAVPVKAAKVAKKGPAHAPKNMTLKKIKSMQSDAKLTPGEKKIKEDEPRKRLVARPKPRKVALDNF